MTQNPFHLALDSITFFAKDGKQKAAAWICNLEKQKRFRKQEKILFLFSLCVCVCVLGGGGEYYESYLRVVEFQFWFAMEIVRIYWVYRMFEVNCGALGRAKHESNHPTENENDMKIYRRG